MVKVGILGAAGYTGGELIRLLINHPDVKIVFANSTMSMWYSSASATESLRRS